MLEYHRTNITDSARTASGQPSSLESLEHVDHAPSMQGPREDKGWRCNISVTVVGGEQVRRSQRQKPDLFQPLRRQSDWGLVPIFQATRQTDDILLLSPPTTLPTHGILQSCILGDFNQTNASHYAHNRASRTRVPLDVDILDTSIEKSDPARANKATTGHVIPYDANAKICHDLSE